MKRTPEEQAKLYMNDSETKVFIDHNTELGEWRYSVVVVGSDGFWLDSFKTSKEVNDFVRGNRLKR